MAESPDSAITTDLQTCFSDLKRHSVSYKLGQTNQTAGDEVQNPLDKQFGLILAKIEEILAKNNKETEIYTKLISMKASIIYEKAKILLSENLLSECHDLLKEALELIKDYPEHPKVAFLHMRIVNHLTYVLSRLGNLAEAKDLLVKAIIDGEKNNPEVFSTDDLFLNTKKDAKVSTAKLNRLTINNMQMLAWIYSRLGNSEQNLKLQHDILQKQLDSTECDVLRWAESCFRLGSMFVTNGDWSNAIYHLIAAEKMLNPLEVSLIPNPEVYAAQADLARTWVYYGLQLFEKSRQPKIATDIEDDDDASDEASNVKAREAKEKLCDLHIFQGLQINLPEGVPVCTIENKEQATALFSLLHKWIKRARLFYTLRDYPLQYVNLCLDLSEMYRFVAFYEEDIEAQYAVQKRRYDALETLSNILREIRPSCYVAVNVELTKELIEVQMEMMNLNLKKLYSPAEVPKLDINEDTLRKQMNAFHNLHCKLENITFTLNTSSTCNDSEVTNKIKREIIEEKLVVEEEQNIKPAEMQPAETQPLK